jgi:hypothetical protein
MKICIEKQIKECVPSTYAGQNLETMAKDNIQDLIDLQQGGWFSMLTGVKMVENFATAFSECFKFKQFAYEIVKNYKKAVKECFHRDPSASGMYLQHNTLDFESICNKFSAYYCTANQDGKWLPTKNVRDMKAPVSNFGGVAATTTHTNKEVWQLLQCLPTRDTTSAWELQVVEQW